MSLGNRPIILVVGQLDLTTVSKRMSLKSVHIFDTTSFDKPAFIRLTFAPACIWQQDPFVLAGPTSARKEIWRFPQKALTFVPSPRTSLSQSFEEHGLRLCHGPPLRTDVESWLLTLPMNNMGCFFQFFFHHFENICHHCQAHFTLEPHAYHNFIGRVPCFFLVRYPSINFWGLLRHHFLENIQEYRYFSIRDTLMAILCEICDPTFDFHFPWTESFTAPRGLWRWPN